MLPRIISLLLALAWMGWIFYLSHQPSVDIPSLFPYQDKVMHFVAYGVLATFLLGSLPAPLPGYGRTQVLLATGLASLYGISDEFHQSFVPGRQPDVLDWLADSAGALVAAMLLAQLSRWLMQKRNQTAA
jgi:VanZ family protein